MRFNVLGFIIVAVIGVPSSDNRRLLATSVTRVDVWGSQAP